MINEQQAAELQASRKFPAVTKESIEAKIKSTDFSVHAGSTLTVAVVTLENGFTVVGKSACASPENFNKALGEKYAYDDAFKKIWALEGYLLREKIYQAQNPGQDVETDDGHTCGADTQKEAA